MTVRSLGSNGEGGGAESGGGENRYAERTRAASSIRAFALFAGLLLAIGFVWKGYFTEQQEGKEKMMLPALQVSGNGRFLVKETGEPFFYLAEDAWALAARSSREDVDLYIRDRSGKQFNVIHTAIVGLLTRPNFFGELAFHPVDRSRAHDAADNPFDPSAPNDAYFEHVDYIVDTAAESGMYTALVPAWGSLVADRHSPFSLDGLRAYGRYLGERYRGKPVLWLLGADRDPVYQGVNYRAKYRALAEGLEEGGAGAQLMSYLPGGGSKSSTHLHHEPWLDFNMNQSGHSRFRSGPDLLALMRDNYAMTPVKPAIDGESGFERIAEGLAKGGTRKPEDAVAEEDRLSDFDIRVRAYWNVFSGAFGHVYGASGVYQMSTPGVADSWMWDPQLVWREALQLPGSAQMGHLRRLIESRAFLTRIPDQSFIASDLSGARYEQIVATRDSEGSFALVYLPLGQQVSVQMDQLAGSVAEAAWFDPRTGETTPIGKFAASGLREFASPTAGEGNDWVLVLDAAAD